jgi:hypothetical protein
MSSGVWQQQGLVWYFHQLPKVCLVESTQQNKMSFVRFKAMLIFYAPRDKVYEQSAVITLAMMRPTHQTV